MMTTELLQDLSAHYEGFIPDALQLSDDVKDKIAFNVINNDDNEAIDYISENSELGSIYSMAPEDAVRELKNAIWAAIESSVRDQIDDYNAAREQRDD